MFNRKEKKLLNFLEAKNSEEANGVDLDVYTFCERMSSKTGTFIFKIRETVRKQQ